MLVNVPVAACYTQARNTPSLVTAHHKTHLAEICRFYASMENGPPASHKTTHLPISSVYRAPRTAPPNCLMTSWRKHTRTEFPINILPNRHCNKQYNNKCQCSHFTPGVQYNGSCNRRPHGQTHNRTVFTFLSPITFVVTLRKTTQCVYPIFILLTYRCKIVTKMYPCKSGLPKCKSWSTYECSSRNKVEFKIGLVNVLT